MSAKITRSRRLATAVVTVALIVGGFAYSELHRPGQTPDNNSTTTGSQTATNGQAATALAKLAVKNAASMAGYSRTQFGGEWASEGSCTMRDKILARDMTDVTYKSTTCEVATGILNDPYTGKIIHFVRGPSTSDAVQIDHVVAIGDAWETGAQQLSKAQREQMYNDPLELLAADGTANDDKGDSDASAWLPPNKPYDCRYVARQIAVKAKYDLWVTVAEHSAMQKVLSTCPTQALPIVSQ